MVAGGGEEEDQGETRSVRADSVKAKMYTNGGPRDRAKTVKWANAGSLKRIH